MRVVMWERQPIADEREVGRHAGNRTGRARQLMTQTGGQPGSRAHVTQASD